MNASDILKPLGICVNYQVTTHVHVFGFPGGKLQLYLKHYKIFIF